jgi:hypothetical protein
VWREDLRGQFKQWWDAGGTFNYIVYCQGYVSVWSTEAGGKSFCRNGLSIPLTAVWVDTVVMRGQVTTKWYRGPATWAACDGTGQLPCYTYTGSFAITVTPVASTLELTAVPSTVLAGDSVTFTASAGGASFTVQEWTWQPDEPPGSSSAGSCTAGVSQCGAIIQESGTMYVRASVGGTVEQAKAHVSVQPDLVRLDANRSSVKPGEKVEFSASTENGTSFTISRWAWDASSLPPNGKPLTSVAACSSKHDCTIEVYESGTMTVTATVSGATAPQDASASVTVTSCDSLGDPRLDNPAIRKKMADALKQSMKDKHELGGHFYKNPTTGEYKLILIPWTGSDVCEVDMSVYPPADSIPPGFVLDPADFHTHPFLQGTTPPSNCNPSNLPAGVKGRIGDGPSEYFYADGTLGGDWPYAAGAGHAGYLLDANGHIHRWNHSDNDPLQDDETIWDRDGDSICFILRV